MEPNANDFFCDNSSNFSCVYNISIYIKIYIIVTPIVAYTIGILIEFYRKKTFYDTLKENMEQLEQKYLISEIIKEPSFAEGKI